MNNPEYLTKDITPKIKTKKKQPTSAVMPSGREYPLPSSASLKLLLKSYGCSTVEEMEAIGWKFN